jgi:thiosulfate dehydrogenase
MKTLIGFLLGLLAVPIFALLYVELGYFPVATSGSPFPFEKKIASAALNARIKREPTLEAPLPVSDENLMTGAKTYVDTCAICHGLTGRSKTPTASGMYPPPPQLFPGKGVSDDPASETFWKVTNGIRLTGMPGYVGSMTDAQRWQVSLFLANANHLPASVSAYLSSIK